MKHNNAVKRLFANKFNFMIEKTFPAHKSQANFESSTNYSNFDDNSFYLINLTQKKYTIAKMK